ncbi:hypothetical protein A1O1_05284 [Capronia coronata CBS 617.96]|uniref:MOSC domain-containing protein n=1 Tax=Capronia coronata CBS 617.96 TaxID=1182541 RepID=W9Z1I5_9EURO|nr:uncharacterized protein A1O1_05284 [Capronia coronata CBS 617.96]EXJ88354.1 hypothetical protein A1O1_05284 [Capronia coronata CBS 617.96]
MSSEAMLLQHLFNLDHKSTYLSIALVLTIISGLLLSWRMKFKPLEKLKVEALYIYPVKGLRGCSLPKATVGQYGFEGDRTFCLQKVEHDYTGTGSDSKSPKYETMYIGYHLRLALFSTCLEIEGDERRASNILVTWTGSGDGTGSDSGNFSGPDSDNQTQNQTRFPVKPDLTALKTIEVSLHGSPTLAYDMGDEQASFFSRHLGFDVRLTYIGPNSRAVLGSIAPHSKDAIPESSWPWRFIRARLPSFINARILPAERLVFNDIAHYLVVTKESNDQVSSRFANGQVMDVTKFRPNIVVSGSSGPFAEDYWAELTFTVSDNTRVKMPLTANCYRCQSITVDYATGKPCEGDQGQVWKKLNKDRRVDKGAKYSPVFGRYGFCSTPTDLGKAIHVGAEAFVTKCNAEHTVFDWPNLTSFGTSQQKVV